jgi:thioredoxin reductase
MNMADTKCTADLVVIGGGAAGMPAALEAMEKGLRSVILIDKSPFMQRLAERDGALSEFTAGLWIDSIETVIVQCDGMLVFRFQNKVVTMD